MRTRALLLALSALAAACGPPEDGRFRGPPQTGELAPPFQATSLAGDTVSLESLRGSPVLLNVWATWCVPCRKETPYLQSIHERLGGRGLRVVGVSVDTRSARRDVDDFVEEFGVTYTILHDHAGRSMDVFSVLGVPATFLIDAEGRVRWKRTGEVREGDRDFETAVESLVEAAEAAGAS